MSVTAAIAVYFALWWVVLFVVLAACARGRSAPERAAQDSLGQESLGQESLGQESPGRERPAQDGLARRCWSGNHLTLKFVATTAIAAVLFAFGAGAYLHGPALLRVIQGMIGARI